MTDQSKSPITTAPEPFEWVVSDEETYDYRLESLWPACNMRRRNMFLLGEAQDSDPVTGDNRYLAHLKDPDGYWTGSRPVTTAEFFALVRRS